ncbi:MAG TPA: flagellar filament capping protein FliD [Opitutaceae bacterium]
MASGLQLSGLASGFDWKTFVDSMMEIERAPITRLEAEKTKNSSQVTQLTTLGGRLTALQTASEALQAEGLFTKRSVTGTATGSSASAATGTVAGNYTFNVTQRATAARQQGASGLAGNLAATADVGALTLANLPIAAPVTAGTFTVNGKTVTVATTDSLEDVFDAISAATSGAVTGEYDPATDKVKLTGTGEIILGAANDSSNFLRAMKLTNNGGSTVSSSASLATLKLTSPLNAANLGTAVTAVDSGGAGSFTINGVAIAYDVDTDSLSTVIKRINQSGAGVTAAYDTVLDRMTLTNQSTGDLGLTVSESTGGLLGALGLTTGSSLTRGTNAQFTLNGGATLTSTSNTLDATAHGVTGLSLTAGAEGSQTLAVSVDTSTMREKIDGFISAFNGVQTFLESSTRVTTDSKGKVTAGTLASNREIQTWGSKLRSLVFAAVPGLDGSVARLENLGIDFKRGTSELEIKDATKLTTALTERPDDVEEFFATSTTGLADLIGQYSESVGELNTKQQKVLNKSNTGIDDQIAAIERRLVLQREIMESAFIAMESAQSQLKSQSSALTNAFSSTSQ